MFDYLGRRLRYRLHCIIDTGHLSRQLLREFHRDGYLQATACFIPALGNALGPRAICFGPRPTAWLIPPMNRAFSAGNRLLADQPRALPLGWYEGRPWRREQDWRFGGSSDRHPEGPVIGSLKRCG